MGSDKPANGAPNEVAFDYIKTPDYREIHVDGAWGGLTPRGYIQMAIYNERLPIPQQTVFELKDAQLGNEIKEKRRGRQAIIRNVEVDLIMDLQTAESMRDWLNQHIGKLKEKLAELEGKE